MASSNILNFPAFDSSAFSTTKLSSVIEPGNLEVPVESPKGFLANQFILIDDLGTERAEKGFMQVAPVALDILIASGVTKQHRQGAPIAVLPYDQIDIYRAVGATEPLEAAFDTLLSTIDTDLESISTMFEDTSPPANAWYKWKYRNSVTDSVSAFMPQTVQFNQKYLYATPQQVLADMRQSVDAQGVGEIIEAVCDIIDSEIARGGRLYYRSVTEVQDMIANSHKYFPTQTPVVSVETLEVLGSDGETWEANTRRKYAYDTRIELDTPFGSTRRQSIRFTYTVGFFDQESIPVMLNMYVRELAARWYKAKKSGRRGDVKSKSLGNYSVTYRDDEYAGSLREQVRDSDVVAHYSKGWEFGSLQSGVQNAQTGISSIFG